MTGGMGGPLGFFDALFGYNKPGEVGFGGQRYQFQPHPMMTEADVRGLGLTMPETTTMPAYEKPLPTGMQGPLELVPEQQTTRDIPLPGFVGTRMDPKTKQALALETFKERRAERQRAQVQKLLEGLITPDEADAAREPLQTSPQPPPTPGTITQTPLTTTTAPTTAPKAPGGKIPLGTPTKEMEDAIAEAHRLYPQVRPELIRAIMARESNFDPTAVSGKGAKGPMGLMPDTQREMGVKDPFNVQESTIGGTRYFAQQLAKYGGDEQLALAAYNAGPGAVDKAGKKVPPFKETQEYVPWVLERAKPGAFASSAAQKPAPAQPGTGMLVAGPGAPAPTTPSPTALRDQARLTKLDAEIPLLQKRLVVLSGHTGAEATAALALGRQVLSDKVTERNTLRNQLGETQRAVEKEQALQPLKLEQARIEADAAAARTLAAKGEERIGVEAGRKMNLPPTTRWKDVPEGVKIYEDPSSTERKVFADLRGSAAGVDTLLTKLDNPEVQKIIGTWFSEPEATFARKVGDYLSTVTPAQRKFLATLAREISDIRHQLAGASQTATELKGLEPFLPAPGDVDVATIRAKLEALKEGILRSHDSYRDQLDQVGIRTPKPLSRPEPKSSSSTGNTGTGSSAAPSVQDRLLKKYAR
jgi:hypothetical protein